MKWKVILISIWTITASVALWMMWSENRRIGEQLLNLSHETALLENSLIDAERKLKRAQMSCALAQVEHEEMKYQLDMLVAASRAGWWNADKVLREMILE